ncbi:MAG: LPS assembly protein LptD [Alphaproteobacteria bacterium]
MLVAAVLSDGGAAHAQLAPDEALLTADEVVFDQDNNVIRAIGNVEIAFGPRILLADIVAYDRGSDTVTATGNVSLVEPSGDVLFAERVVLTRDLQEGLVEQIRVLMSDRTRIAAHSGVRSSGNRTRFRRAVFSPCELCAEAPERAPLWQITARTVTHDQTAQQITYNHAFMEIYGVPVFYTPYFSHPDPTVDRKSGFLAPTYRSSETLGSGIEVPYYWAIAGDKDATFAPIYYSDVAPVMQGEYRQTFDNGFLTVNSSATNPDRLEGNARVPGSEFRGHVESTGRFAIDDTWRWGFDANRSTDDTYLRRYRLGNLTAEQSLTSNAFVEGFRGRNYAAANTFFYQGLRAGDDPDTIPVILPVLDYRHVGTPGRLGLRTEGDANLLVLERDDGTDSRRLALRGGVALPYTAPAGDIYTLRADIRADAYHAAGVVNADDPTRTGEGFAGRVFPQVSLEWRYPFVRRRPAVREVFEPIAEVIMAPTGGNSSEIPNEDSLAFEYSAANLFSDNRFPGFDRVETGPRANYGLRYGVYADSGASATALVGQSYRLHEDSVFSEVSGLSDHVSDVVGRVNFNLPGIADITYRARFNKDDLTARRSELLTTFGPSRLRTSISYGFYDADSQSGFQDREELSASMIAGLNDYWSVFVRHRRSLVDDGGSLSSGLGAIYQDECYQMELSLDRNFTVDRDLQPDDTLFVRIVFKHLGQVAPKSSF